MWVWGSGTSIIQDSSSRAEFFHFCANPPGSKDPNAVAGFPGAVNMVYLYAHSFVNGDSTHKAELHSFLKDAHSLGIRVDYLDGDTTWATTDSLYAEQYVRYVLQFNLQTSDPSERFDGIQFDVEPYLLWGWKQGVTQQIQIWNDFMDLLTYCKKEVDSANAGTQFGVAIPRWYDSTPGINYLHQLQNIVDYVAIMDYQNTSARIISGAGAEILYATQIGKAAYIGVETSNQDAALTFYGLGWGNMEGQMYQVDEYFRGYGGYAGIAIEHYDSYDVLPKWGTGGTDTTPPALIGGRYIQDSAGGYFQFHVVDICGSGLNEDSTEAGSRAVNLSSGSESVAGSWVTDSTNYISFHPVPGAQALAKYLFTIHAVDSVGNSLDTKDTIAAVPTEIEEGRTGYLKNFDLLQNYPNPFNPTTIIAFDVQSSGFVALKVYDILGRRVATLVDGRQSAGKHSVVFDGSRFASGVYFYALQQGSLVLRDKMLLLK